jgi:hypothetical protein
VAIDTRSVANVFKVFFGESATVLGHGKALLTPEYQSDLVCPGCGVPYPKGKWSKGWTVRTDLTKPKIQSRLFQIQNLRPG